MAAQTITKVQYVDNETVIGASNLNAIQDAVNNHAGLIDDLDNDKVDKIAGKGLSTNDFNNDAQSKLNNLPTGAQLDTSFGNKVDKRTTGTEVYTHTGSTQGGATLTETPTAGAVPQYGTDGVLKAGAPVAANDVVRKAELDEVVDEMSDSTTGLGSKAPAIIETVGPAAIASFDDGADGMPVKKLVANIEPQQDLHGYDSPWPAGGNVNILDADGYSFTTEAGTDKTTVIDKPVYLEAGVAYTFSCRQTANAGTATRNLLGVVTETGTTALVWEQNNSAAAHVHQVIFTPSTSGYYRPIYWAHTLGTAVTLDQFQVEEGSAFTAYSPYSNICPISGWTGAEIEGRGKNLTTTALVYNDINVIINPLYLLPGTYTYSYTRSTPATWFYVRRGDTITLTENVIAEKAAISMFITFTVSEADYYYIQLYKSASTTSWNDAPVESVQLELGSTATAYEPFQSKEISITFPSSAGTVYGGTLTINPDRTGELKVTEFGYTFDGTEEIISPVRNDLAMIRFTNKSFKSWSYDSTKHMSSHFMNASEYGWGGVANKRWLAAGGNYFGFGGYTKAEFKEYAAEQFANGTPITCYTSLVDPVLVPLTATEIDNILTILYGTNNIWADCGDVDVTYAADTKLYIEHLTQPTEDDMTADHAISAGTFFQLGNTLYLATSQIAAGGTITPGTNATQLSLADALNQVNA